MLLSQRKEPQKQFLSFHKNFPTSKAVFQDGIETLENVLNQSTKAAENRKPKQMVKIKKKKMHEEQVKAMGKALTIKSLLLQDEAFGWEKNTYRYCHLANAKIIFLFF